MDFHEWMERHRKTAATSSDSGIENELDLSELVTLGETSGIPHPFSLKGSPFFNKICRESVLELKNSQPSHRPFEDLKAITLVDLKEKDN